MEDPNRFFHAAEADYPDAPTWSGELYLELHRGTFTSQARTKVGNRRSEHLLREAELWAATAAVLAGSDYPYDDLDRLWKQVLLHQFHDILPGSSIAWVHREAEATYAGIRTELESIVGAPAATITAGPGIGAEVDDAPLSATPAAVWVLNAGLSTGPRWWRCRRSWPRGWAGATRRPTSSVSTVARPRCMSRSRLRRPGRCAAVLSQLTQ